MTTRRGRRPAARSGSPPMCLAQTWHIPGVDLPRTPACPACQRTVQLPGGAGSAVPQLEPGHRPPAAPPPAPPGGQLRHQPQPRPLRLTTAGRSCGTPAAAVGDLDPDHAAGGPDRDRDRLPFRARAAVPDAVPEQLAPSSAASSPHGCPGPSTPAVNARATRARSARPATVTLSRTTALAISAPAFPARPAPGKPPGTAAGHTGCTPDSAAPRQARNTPPARPVRGRP